MTPNFKELREELEEVFRYEERYRETGYIHPDVEDWEEAVWRNRFTILTALELASKPRITVEMWDEIRGAILIAINDTFNRKQKEL